MNILQNEPALQKSWLPLVFIAILTIAIFIISIISLISGWVTIFQNLFYFPIILACAYYVKRGFLFSVLLACAYFVLICIFSNDILILEGALVRVIIFILVAAMITYLSMVRKRAEEIALNTRSNFEAFFNTIDDFLYVLDEQGNVLNTNDTVIRRLGYTKKEILSLPVLKMSQQGLSENEEQTVQDKLPETCDFYSPLPLVNKEGCLIPVETRVTRGEWDGKPVLFVIRKDISQLKLSEEKFSTAFHLNASLMALATKTDRKFIEVNRAFLKTLGFSRDEVIGKTATELNIFVNPQTENDILADLDKFGIVKNNEVQVRKKDGRIRTVLFSVDRIRIGIEHCLLSTFNDITELKLSESALHESEEKYRSLIENSHEIIYTITTKGIFTFVSPSWTIQLGHPVTQVVGRAFTQFVHPDDIARCWVFMQNVIETGPQAGVEYRVLHSDGTWRWHSTGAVPLRNDAGAIVAFEGCASDITERKKAEEAMLESEGRFRTLLQHVPSVSVQGYNMEGVTHYWNDASQILYGYTPEEAIGKNIVDLIIPTEMREEVRQACRLMAETGHPIPASELSLMRKDGSMVSVFSSHALVKRPGGEMEQFCIDIDLTGRKLAEDTLLRVNQKLNILSELTRKNLTTQIFILNSYLKLAKKQAKGQDHIIESIKKGEQAALAINEITEITRDYQDMGIYPPKWQNVKIVFLLGLSHITTGSIIRHSLETKNLEIFADPLLEKAFQGLFENSINHGDHVSRVRVWHTTSPYGATIVFEDDGSGIPYEQKESVFLRIEGRKTQVRGLFFIREILDITGITIHETGEPGKGVRFEITVPDGKWRF